MLKVKWDEKIPIHQTEFVFVPLFSKQTQSTENADSCFEK